MSDASYNNNKSADDREASQKNICLTVANMPIIMA